MGKLHVFCVFNFILICFISTSWANVVPEAIENHLHSQSKASFSSHKEANVPREAEDASHWNQLAQEALNNKLQLTLLETRAKNIVFFLGDGMSTPTLTGTRIFKGQRVLNSSRGGEEASLHFDNFPFTGVSKTYCADSQVADSACSSTAYLRGIKANLGTIGVTVDVKLGDCVKQSDPRNQVSSLLQWAQAAGKATGFVTTTRITHASPAGTYAHAADRDWESDSEMVDLGGDPTKCEDIAKQLIMNEPGNKFKVILGGGRRQFYPKTWRDPESDQKGRRADGLDLVQIWKDSKFNSNATFAHVEYKDDLLNLDTKRVDNLLGIFAPSNLGYLDESAVGKDPTLVEMTSIAIEILQKNEQGFVLFVEGGLIDRAHHDNMAQRAFWETLEFEKAVEHADRVTDDNDTLIIVTADHAHVMSIAGYPARGDSILGLVTDMADDNLPFTTIGYANGPSFEAYVDNRRPNLTGRDFQDILFQQVAPVPLDSETHGGDDVLIFSKGPFAHLLTGVQEQSYIPHALAYAACLNSNDATHCKV